MRKQPNHNNTNDRSDCENVLDSEGSVSEESFNDLWFINYQDFNTKSSTLIHEIGSNYINICIFLLKLEQNILNSAGTYEATGDH